MGREAGDFAAMARLIPTKTRPVQVFRRFWKQIADWVVGGSPGRFILAAMAPCLANSLLLMLAVLPRAVQLLKQEENERLLHLPQQMDGAGVNGKLGLVALLTLVILVAPCLETLVGQALPIALTSLLTTNRLLIVAIATSWFAVLHIIGPAGPIKSLYVLVPSAVMAFSFLYWRGESRWKAFWVTTTIHMLNNLSILVCAALAAYAILRPYS